MTQEEQNIKQKIENLSDLDIFFDGSDLWNRLEEKLDKKEVKKPTFLWLWAAAACIVLGMFLFVELREKPLQQSLVLEKEDNGIVAKYPTRSVGRPNPSPIGGGRNNSLPIGESWEGITLQSTDNQIVTKEIEQKQLNFELTKLNPKTKIDSIYFNKKAIAYEPKFKAEQVTIVDFPLIPDAMMMRESFAKRAFRQLKNFNTEGKIDWRELDIEPRNVWAYLERNFKYDTTTISNKKHNKL